MKYRENKLPGYFTVEAAMVVSVVIGFYVFLITILLYMYEICIWEQNACRMLVWREYVRGYSSMYTEIEENVSEEQVVEYVLRKNAEEEKTKYILAQNVRTNMYKRGKIIKVTRSMEYPLYADLKKEYSVTFADMNPAQHIRMSDWVTESFVDKERADDDKE